MIARQLSLWDDILPAELGDDGPEYVPPDEAEWMTLVSPADEPPSNNHSWLYHRCGTRYCVEQALTDDGLQFILICFECGVYWRTGQITEGVWTQLSVRAAVASAQKHFDTWKEQRDV